MLVEPNFDRVQHIANRLRPLDRKEVFSQRWDDDPNAMAKEYLEAAEPSWVFSDPVTREPIYYCGMFAIRPGCFGIFGWGTPLFPRVAGEVTRTMRRVMVPAAATIGHRFECACLAEKESAIRWLERLGATVESTLVAYGRNREDFKMLVWRF